MPEELANQIAAGEVVERPSSVVKELVENSLDAGAQRIDVDIENGGLGLCRITDDGAGMSQEDAELCLLRHATSKLRCADDLFRLQTMGFRGEALASIASVARLTLTTRTRDAVAAYRITTEAGQKTSPSREVGGPVGTQIEVRDLFFNVPARLKFMKTEATESGHIAESLIRLSLAFPGVHFKLRHKGKVTLDLPPHKSPLERSRAALASRGKGAGAPTLYHAQLAGDGVAIEAHLGAPDDATSTPRNVFLLVNHRFVRDRALLHAAQAGYGELLERGRYPLLVLHVKLDAATVDVNVHPQKLEVRMANADAVYSLVRTALRNLCVQAPWLVGVAAPARQYVVSGSTAMALEAHPAYGTGGGEAGGRRGLPAAGDEASEPVSQSVKQPGGQPAAAARDSGRAPRPSGGGAAEHQLPLQPQWGAGLAEHRARLRQAVQLYAPAAAEPGPPADADADVSPASPAAAAPADPPVSAPTGVGPEKVARMSLQAMTYLGQLLRTYLLCEGDGELILIDQHAAHERVVYERLRRAHTDAPLLSQRLLFPASMELDDRRAALLNEHGETMTRLGFEVRPFGGRSFALCAAPDLGAYGRGAQVHRDPEHLLRQVLEELDEGGRSDALRERADLLLATMACHAAVRAGDVLDATKALALLQAMDEVDYSPYCPHGRPVLVRLSRSELERRFGRA
jgi:DNA mismatch repair protein MutL